MTIALPDIHRCFEGEIPAVIVTADRDGMPNLGHLSQVFAIDEQHVAVSNQFMSKTVANLAVNPVALVLAVDPTTLHSYRLLLRHLRSESEGDVFNIVRRSVDAIAAMTGMSSVFALRSVEVFRVVDVELVPTRGVTEG